MKKVSFGARPAKRATPDDWVMDGDDPAEPLKRLTIDIPLSLHRRAKVGCALENLRMADVVRQHLEQRFPAAAEAAAANTETQKHGNTENREPASPQSV